ncbi:MAG: hypothetical protein IJK22_10155 [Bacteroidales bacterium]|nr:hypothetical protein [Bacteroidales bacterium]
MMKKMEYLARRGGVQRRRGFPLWQAGGLVWPVNALRFRKGSSCRKDNTFSSGHLGQTEWYRAVHP